MVDPRTTWGNKWFQLWEDPNVCVCEGGVVWCGVVSGARERLCCDVVTVTVCGVGKDVTWDDAVVCPVFSDADTSSLLSLPRSGTSQW